jgi:hypothetical protein
MKKVGTHCHDDESDGHDTVEEFLEQAIREKMAGLCRTNHDFYSSTFDELAEEAGILTIPAMEISANYNNRFFVHLLVFGVDPEKYAAHSQKLRKNWEANDQSVRSILDTVKAAFGIELSLADIYSATHRKGPCNFITPALAHISQVLKTPPAELLNRLFAEGFSFKKILEEGHYLSLVEVVEFIHSIGAKIVPAHWEVLINKFYAGPKPTREEVEKLFYQLVDMGIAGLEVFYPEHSKEQTVYLWNLAKKCGLWPTAGSDWHGIYKPNGGLWMPGMSFEEFLEFRSFCER